jgi:hypothetical protein
MAKQSHKMRNGLICALFVAACVWAAWPVSEIGFDDDWSYIKTAQVFAQTGHLVYNGWGSPILGWQVFWGALFIKLFGFSFTVVRLSILPIAVATVFLFHTILLRFGVNPRNAVLGTLTLGLSPLFLPLAASYMTDIPGMLVTLLCLYLCQRAIAASSSRITIAWLCLAVASNLIGGTARQIAWLGALVMVPSTGWLLRKRRGVLPASFSLWVVSLASVFVCMRWFARQPYSVTEPLIFNHGGLVIQIYVELISAALCLLLLVYPILAAWLLEVRLLNRAAILQTASIILLLSFFEWTTRMPWLPDVMQEEFAATRTDLYSLSPPPLFLPAWGRKVVSLLVIATAWILLKHLRGKLRPPVTSDAIQAKCWQDILWLLGPFSLSYFVLIVYYLAIFDRYLLPLMAVAIICLLRLHQERIAGSLPAISVAVLSIFAVLAIGGTHDWFAWNRARLAALGEIRASGVPRTEIQGGLEYDGWTQIEDGGYINDPRLKVPAGAYHPDIHLPAVAAECRFDFAPYTPAIHPKFSTVFPKMGCLAPSRYPAVIYRTWLPPFHGTIYIQEVPDGPS